MNIKRIPQKPQERWTPDIGQDGLGIPTASAMIARRIGKKKAPGSPGKSKSQSPPEDAMSRKYIPQTVIMVVQKNQQTYPLVWFCQLAPPDPMMKSVFTFKPLKRSLESPRKIVMYDATPVPSIASPPTLLSLHLHLPQARPFQRPWQNMLILRPKFRLHLFSLMDWYGSEIIKCIKYI